MKISFGMIFSIILIVFFLGFSFYAIQKFLAFQKSIQVGQFTNNLQKDIDKMWAGTAGSAEEEYILPSKIDYICLLDSSLPVKGPKKDIYTDLRFSSSGTNNIFFYPPEATGGIDPSINLKHIDVEKIVEIENPYCIPNKNGKVKLTVKMDLGDSLVTLTR